MIREVVLAITAGAAVVCISAVVAWLGDLQRAVERHEKQIRALQEAQESRIK